MNRIVIDEAEVDATGGTTGGTGVPPNGTDFLGSATIE